MDSGFFASFVQGEDAARALLPARPLDEGAWEEAARRAGERALGPELRAELRRQAAALPSSAARDQNLEALGRRGTTVVVTGQQVGLFLGPLYTLYKAATAVARARLVSQRTGRPCIPLFWLQTEDHDGAEIARAEFLVAVGRRVLALSAAPPAEARVSVSHRVLPPEVETLTAALADLLEPLPYAGEVASLVARHYRPGISPGAAFAGLIAELFREEGLVALDPRTPAVAKLAAPVLRRAIEDQSAVAEVLFARSRELAARGFAEQVPTRRDASLVFFHPRGPGGPRYRLVVRGKGFETPEGPVALDELLQRLDEDPLGFSTSALLRPLVQDRLLPTAAYVAGPAECNYFAQLPPLYALFGVDFPLIAPRCRLRIVDGQARRDLERLGLRPEDLERPRPELFRRLAARPNGLPGTETIGERLLGPLDRELQALAPLFERLDPRLERNVRKTRRLATLAVHRLLARVERVVVEKDLATSGRLERLLEALRPSGMPQERVYAFPALAARVGPRPLVRALVEAAEPLSLEVRDVTL